MGQKKVERTRVWREQQALRNLLPIMRRSLVKESNEGENLDVKENKEDINIVSTTAENSEIKEDKSKEEKSNKECRKSEDKDKCN